MSIMHDSSLACPQLWTRPDGRIDGSWRKTRAFPSIWKRTGKETAARAAAVGMMEGEIPLDFPAQCPLCISDYEE